MIVGNNGIKVKGHSATMFGMEGTISVHCYAAEADFGEWLPTFDGILDSFKYDPGYEFVSAPKRPSGPTEAQRRNLESLIYWMLGMLAMLIAYMLWKRQRMTR
jgi:hypothetical protein